MDGTTINQAPQTSLKDRERHEYYFTPVWAKVRGVIQFCKHMGIEYFKKIYFKLSIFFIIKVMSFYIITYFYVNYTEIQIRKRFVGAANLLVQKKYVR